MVRKCLSPEAAKEDTLVFSRVETKKRIGLPNMVAVMSESP